MFAGVAVVVAAAGLGAAADAATGSSAGPAVNPGWRAVTQNDHALAGSDVLPEDMDGDDPRARGCVADAQVLDEVPIYLAGGATPFGTLRHSPHCGTDWASAYYPNPNLYTITLTVYRPADSAQVRSDWSNNTPPGSYSDMLSTRRGCVWVSAVVKTPAGSSAPARTRCLR